MPRSHFIRKDEDEIEECRIGLGEIKEDKNVKNGEEKQ